MLLATYQKRNRCFINLNSESLLLRHCLLLFLIHCINGFSIRLPEELVRVDMSSPALTRGTLLCSSEADKLPACERG